jgi:hypothetical protein
METGLETPQVPQIETPPVAVQPPVEAPAPVVTSSASSYEDGGAFEGKTPAKYKMVDILIMALWIVVPIYAITYYRKAIKKLDEQPSTEEFDNMSGDVDEVKYNLKKALGKKYEAI